MCPLVPPGVENQDPGERATAEQDGVVTLLATQRDASQASLNDQAALGNPASTRLSTSQRKSFKKKAKKAMLAAGHEHAVVEAQVVDTEGVVATQDKVNTEVERSSTEATKVAAAAKPPRCTAQHAKQSTHTSTPSLSTTSSNSSVAPAAVPAAGMSRAAFATLLQFMIAVPVEGGAAAAPAVPSSKSKVHSQRPPAQHFQAASHPKGAFRCPSSRR